MIRRTLPGWLGLELEPVGPYGHTRWTVTSADGVELTDIADSEQQAREQLRQYMHSMGGT